MDEHYRRKTACGPVVDGTFGEWTVSEDRSRRGGHRSTLGEPSKRRSTPGAHPPAGRRQPIDKGVIDVMWWYGPGMSGWGYALMTISMVLFWALIIVGVVALVRYLARGDRPAPAPRPTAEQLLAERFARGELTEQEYRDRLDTLQAQGPGGPVPRR
ncbi:SHOCT domain-containing protein [Pseudonocardia hispaniensis]|uniref:SHOCT domain-containing protein n=1 Tax=Pseudonocardia hispaniensis TaxID=904933 RepID=A0ABW1J7A9_9PSEU